MAQESAIFSTNHPVFKDKEAAELIKTALTKPSYQAGSQLWEKMGESSFYVKPTDDFVASQYWPINSGLDGFINYLGTKEFTFAHFFYTLKCHGYSDIAEKIKTYLAKNTPKSCGMKIYELGLEVSNEEALVLGSILMSPSIPSNPQPVWICIGKELTAKKNRLIPFETAYNFRSNSHPAGFDLFKFCNFLYNQSSTYTIQNLKGDLEKHGYIREAAVLDPYL